MKETVKLLCKQQGLSLSKVAEKMGVTPQGLNLSLQGNMRLKTLIKLSEALGVSPATLLPNYQPAQNVLPINVSINGVSIEITQEDVLHLIAFKTAQIERES